MYGPYGPMAECKGFLSSGCSPNTLGKSKSYFAISIVILLGSKFLGIDVLFGLGFFSELFPN